jgi:predicted porin
MKKTLFAVAAATAFTGAAQAQSSVTVYGLLDIGYLGGYTVQRAPTIGGGTAASTSINSLTQQTNGIGGGGQSSSRLGFRGVEDLGGGMTAFFTLEAAVNESANGLLSTSNTGNRLAFVGLSKKGLGSAQGGIVYTPIFEEVAVTDAGQQNNVGGNVIHDRAGGLGSTSNASGVSMTGITRSGMSTNDSYTVRSANTIVFKTDRFSGVQAKAMIMAAGTESNASPTTATSINQNNGYGANLNFNGVKNLYLTASYQTFSQSGYYAGASLPFAPGYNGGSITTGTNASDVQQYYAASYDFGILTGYLQYVSRKVTNINDQSNYVKRTAQQIGVRSQLTPVTAVWASAGTGRFNPNGTGAQTANITGWQVGSQYNLSKRTNLYAIYGASSTSNAVNTTYGSVLSGAALTAAPYSANISTYAVGVRHTF